MSAKKIKPVLAWDMWCVFLDGQPMLDTLSPYEWQAARAAEGWAIPAIDQWPEIRKLRITPVTKRKVKR